MARRDGGNSKWMAWANKFLFCAAFPFYNNRKIIDRYSSWLCLTYAAAAGLQ